MAHFALLWKARTIEKYRQKYENEKINSIIMSNAEIPDKTLFQRWRHYSHGLQNRLSRTFSKWYPEGTTMSNFYMSFRTDNMKLPHILLRSLYGFVGGLLLTYLGFMFFVFQLSLSLVHATVLSSVLGILITLGLTFSNRIRCLIFLLIPQLFSRVGRYTLTCYALVLILTGPATNTLKNSEVLSESMACSQEQIKANVNEINKTIKKPFNSIKDSMKITIQSMKLTVAKLKKALIRINRLILSIASVTQSGYSWLGSVTETCNDILGKPYDKCMRVMKDRISNYEEKRNAHRNKKSSNSKDNTHTIKNSDVKDPNKDDKLKGGKIVKDAEVRKKHYGILRHALNKHSTNDYWATIVCSSLKTYNKFCVAADFVEQTFLATIRRKIRTFINRLSRLLYVKLNFHHSYIFIGNSSTNSQIASGIVTEIRNRADPILTWLSWSSCVTSLFLLLIIFRAKHYQHMFETRSRFDNRFITKEFRELDLKRLRERRETVLPLNRRERAKYVTTTSFRLVGSEKIHLNRSAVFMTVTTFKLLIHIVADYSLYWVLMTIRQHGKLQSPLHLSEVGSFMSGSGFVSHLLQSFIDSLNVHLSLPPLDNACLPNPYPPDVKRYCQIGFLIFLLWFFAIFEPYGLRLRHIIMGHYRPERAKTRAVWLYNHILRTRGSFMKFARRRLHREYKYSSQSNLTLRSWLQSVIPFGWLRSLLGIKQDKPRCLLCNITEKPSDRCTALIKCQVPACPGTYCKSCFTDIGELCTICLAPSDYGDLSDMSLERGSSNDDSSDDNDDGDDFDENDAGTRRGNVTYRTDTTSKASKFDKEKRFMSIMERKNETGKEIIPLIKRNTETDITKHVCFQKSEVTAMQILSNKSESPFKFTQINLENKIHKKDYYKTSIYRRDENNNNVPLQLQRKGITTSLLQYSAYKIKPTGKPFIMKTKQNLTLLAKYLRKKGIIRCRKNKAMKKKQKRIYKKKKYRTKTKKNNAKKRLNKENSIRKRKIYQTKKSQKVNVSYFMTCSTPRNDDKENCNEIKKSDDCEDEKNDEKKTEDDPHESKSIGNNNETHELNNKSKNSATRCICMQKIHTLLHKYCFNQKSATLVKKSKTNSTCVKEMTHVKKKKRKKPKSQSKSVKIRQKKDFPKNSRLLAYLDEWDWMQNHFASHRPTTVKKNLHTKKNNVYKDRKLTNIDEKADVEIVNDVEIPHLNLKLITETTVEVEDDTFVKDPTTVGDGITLQTRNSFTRGALDRFFKTMFICRPFSRKEINHSCSSKDKKLTVCNKANETKEPESQHNKRVLTSFQSNRLPRPYSLLKSVYSSLLLRLNMGNESVATVDSKKIVETDNKEVTVLPKTCSCAVQYDLETERIETADFSAQVDLIVQDKTKLLVDAQVSAVQTMCTCATQYQIANVNIGTSYTNSALAVLDCITEAMNNSQSLPSDQFSTQSEETQTNTTMCSISHTRFNCAQYEDKQPKRFKDTCLKSHQFTITERPKNRDVSTTTFDWWSPMSDKKVTKCEKKEKKKRRDYEVAKNEEQKIERKVTAAEKLVKFNSSAQVIPNNCLFDKTRQGRRTLEDSRFDDIISPSRYLLESQRYYNELFYSSFNVRPAGGKMDQVQKQQNPERSHSQVCCRQKNRRGRKTNRLEDTSIQANPRERSE